MLVFGAKLRRFGPMHKIYKMSRRHGGDALYSQGTIDQLKRTSLRRRLNRRCGGGGIQNLSAMPALLHHNAQMMICTASETLAHFAHIVHRTNSNVVSPQNPRWCTFNISNYGVLPLITILVFCPL